MSSWSRPYLYASETGGKLTALELPTIAAGPSPTPGSVGLPVDAKLVVRWRAPGRPNPCRRTFTPGKHDAALALMRSVSVAHAAPDLWRPDTDGRPVENTTGERNPTAARPPARARAVELAPVDPTGQTVVGPHNAVLRAVGDGRLVLGSTVSDVIDKVIAKRMVRWGAHQDTNVRNALAFVRHELVYREPNQDDGPEVTAWKRARLDLDGVEEGGSLHLSLILAPDLEDALVARRTTDRRTDLWNLQARIRWERAWARHLDAVAAQRAGTRRAGRLPARPADRLELRATTPIGARTEQLFLQQLRAVLAYAARNGLLSGPNPWDAFAADGASRRRPRPLKVHERNVPPIGAVAQIAAQIATIGRIDPSTGRPVGDRFRAAVLVAAAAFPRPSELWALAPDAYEPGDTPCVVFTRSAGPANTASTEDGSSWDVRERLKDRDPGEMRRLELPRAVADALDEHIRRGYSSPEYLFTGPEGGPVRWNAYTHTYWRPAVAAVLGDAGDPLLRDMPLRWLRKAGITWMLRAGMDPVDVAELAGHDPAILFAHYAGVVRPNKTRRDGRRTWHGVEDAWAWAVQETAIT